MLDLLFLLPALAILAFAAAFHLHWALGGTLGLAVSLPQTPDGSPVMKNRLPLWRPAAGVVVLCLLGLALLMLSRTGYVAVPLPAQIVRIALLISGVAFVARAIVPNTYVGLFKSLRTTRWAKYDTRLFSPLFLLLGLLILFLAA